MANEQGDKLDALDRALELIAMPTDQAIRARWADGWARYGDVWVGRHPLVEAFLEALDLVNYLRKADRIGDLRTLRAGPLIAGARQLAGLVHEELALVAPERLRELREEIQT